jgi:hypothetical protein
MESCSRPSRSVTAAALPQLYLCAELETQQLQTDLANLCQEQDSWLGISHKPKAAEAVVGGGATLGRSQHSACGSACLLVEIVKTAV